MARSTFYYHLKNRDKEDKYKEEKAMITAIFHKHKGRYGYRRITMDLHNTFQKLCVSLQFGNSQLIIIENIIKIEI